MEDYFPVTKSTADALFQAVYGYDVSDQVHLTEIAGVPAFSVTAVNMLPNVLGGLMMQSVLFEIDDEVYNFGYIAPPSAFETFGSLSNEIMASLKVSEFSGANLTATPEGVSADFKAYMDAFEQLSYEYIALKQRLEDNPNDLTLVSQFIQMHAQIMEKTEELAVIGESLNMTESIYFVEVLVRIHEQS
jgi:hypothetical protein